MIKVTIGAAPTNSVVLTHPSVSPFHLEIVQDDSGNYLLTDLSSTYGTFVNGYRIQGVVQLRNTDIVNAGQVALPWQNYFMYNANPAANIVAPVGNTATPPQFGSTPVTETIAPVKKSNKKKVLLFVGGGVLIVILGILALLYFYTKPSYAHLRYIPSNALMVTSVNFKSIAGKIDLDKLQKLDFFMDMKDHAREESESFSKALGDPLTSGIDIFSQPYGFVVAENDEYIRYSGGVVFSLKSEDDFHQFVQRLAKDEQIESNGNFHYLKLDGESCLAWNSKGGIFYVSDRSNARKENYCRSLLEQPVEESILSNENFSTFRDAKYDIGFFINYNSLYSIPGVNLPNSYRGASSMATIDFNDGKLSYASEYFPSKDASATSPMSVLGKKGINDDLKNSISGKSYGIATMSIDLKSLYDILNKDPKMSEGLDEFAKNLKVDRTQLAGILTGDVYLSMADVKQTTKESYNYDYYEYEGDGPSFTTKIDTVATPSFILGFTVKDSKIVDDIIEQAHPLDSSAGIKYFRSWLTPSYYFTKRGSNYYFTNDYDMASQLNATGKVGTSVSGKMAAIISADPMYSYFNMNLSKYPAIVPKYFKDQMSEREYPSFNSFISMFDYAELQGDGVKQNLDIYFIDKGNCLNTFFKVGNEIYLEELHR